MTAGHLERALARSAARAGATLSVDSHRAVAWHSATFSGDRHELTLRAAADPALDAWTAGFAQLDLGMHGHLLADLRVAARERHGSHIVLRVEGLTVACAPR